MVLLHIFHSVLYIYNRFIRRVVWEKKKKKEAILLSLAYISSLSFKHKKNIHSLC